MSVETTAPFRRVVGTLIRGVADGLMGGAQGIPLAGAQVTATASVKSAASGEFIVLDPVDGTTDQNARLRNAMTGEEGILLLVTDDPSIGVIGWTWHITVTAPSLQRPGQPPRSVEFDIDVPSGEGDLDLATLVPVPGNVGEDVILWRAAVEQTAANLAAAEAIVATSVNDAAVEGDILVLKTREGGRIEAGNVRGPEGQSAYEIWLAQGNVGTVEDWQATTKGADGSNVLPDDEAVAQTIETADSLTNSALDRRGPVKIDVGETNRTSELQEWISDLSAGLDRGYLRPGVYVAEGLVLPALTGLRGDPMTSRFGTGLPNRWSSVIIRRPAGSVNTVPVVSLDGAGSTIEGITLHGNLGYGTVLSQQGFESSVKDVRIIQSRGIGWDVKKANNAKIDTVWVDNCGSSTAPAVRIQSVTGAGHAVATNAQVFRALTIERAINTALQIGSNESTMHPVEWCSFTDLHIESPDDNGAVGNGAPLIDIMSVKGIAFINAMVYGGPGVLLRHNQTQHLDDLDAGGIRLIGGAFLGQEPWGPTPHIVDLVRGNNFAALGTKFDRHTAPAIRIAAEYGPGVMVDPTCSFLNNSDFQDVRGTKRGWRMPGSLTAMEGMTVGRSDLQNPTHRIQGASGSVRRIQLDSGVVSRWFMQANATPESGSNSGSDLEIIARSDTGASLGTAMSIRRSNRQTTFHYPVGVPATPTSGRPTPAAAGPGAHLFDTTLNKPLWSDGTYWRDASGVAV